MGILTIFLTSIFTTLIHGQTFIGGAFTGPTRDPINAGVNGLAVTQTNELYLAYRISDFIYEKNAPHTFSGHPCISSAVASVDPNIYNPMNFDLSAFDCDLDNYRVIAALVKKDSWNVVTLYNFPS